MKTLVRQWLLPLALGAWLTGAVLAAPPERVVTLGGSVTEIVYALGAGDRLVGDDDSSLYPLAATRLPRVGYYRTVPVEGVAALKPDLVLASEHAGPPLAMQRLGALGIPTVVVPDTHAVDSLYARIRAVARALDVEPAGQALVAQVRRELDAASALPGPSLRTVLLVNRSGRPQGAGADTAADVVMKMAGLVNVLADRQRGYKPLSAEGLAVLEPELIIVTQASLQASGGLDKLLALPALATTAAAQRRRVVVMDDLLVLGLGPRLPQAIRQLKAEAAHVAER